MHHVSRVIALYLPRAALLLAAIAVAGCKIDLGATQDDNNNGNDQTNPVGQTRIAGLAVAQSDSSVDTSFNRLRNAIGTSQGLRVQAIDFVTGTNGNGNGGQTGTGTGTTGSGNTGTGAGAGGTQNPGTGAGAGGNPNPGSGAGAGGTQNPGTGAGAGGSPNPGSGAGAGGTQNPGTGAGAGGAAGPNSGFDAGNPNDFGNTTNPGTGGGNGFGTSPGVTNGTQNTLRPTRLLLIDNPNRLTPILRSDPRAALDLPGILVYRDGNANVGVAYDTVDYLRARYQLGGANAALNALSQDLRNYCQSAAGTCNARVGSVSGISQAEGILRRSSNNNFSTTVNRLGNAINTQLGVDPITLDNRSLAVSVGADLNPSTLFIFDVVGADRALLSANQTVGIDLPQRILVTQLATTAQVVVYYNDPAFIARRHAISGRGDAIDTLRTTLSALADSATGTTANGSAR